MCGIVGYLGKGDAYPALIKGFEAMVPAILILTLAWTLKSMTDSLGAAANGHELCFSIINNGIMHGSNARHFADKVCNLLCQP